MFLYFRDLLIAAPIEATRPAPSRPHTAHFRDLLIAAPLKPARRGSAPRGMDHFRDLLIAAPLKRRLGLGLVTWQWHFRDLLIAAPLKQPSALGSDIVAGVRRIKEKSGPHLVVWGSSTLTPVLLEHGLADEILLLVFPVLLGKGKRFFSDGTPPCEQFAAARLGRPLTKYPAGGDGRREQFRSGAGWSIKGPTRAIA